MKRKRLEKSSKIKQKGSGGRKHNKKIEIKERDKVDEKNKKRK